MKVLTRLTLRNLKLNRKRTIVTIIGIILSAAMICGVAALIESFQDLFIESAKATDGNFHATFYDVPYKNKGLILENANTRAGMLSRDVGIARPEHKADPEKPYILVKAYDDAAFENMPVQLKSGRFPMRHGEIVISEQLAADRNQGWEIGQEITLSIGNREDAGQVLDFNEPLTDTEEFKEIKRESYRITGIMKKPRFESFANPGYIAITYLDESLFGSDDRVNISVLLDKPKEVYNVVPQMAEAAGIENFSYNNELLRWMGISKNDNYNRLITSVGLIVITLIAIGSVSVIYNAFAISVSERKKQFGMLSSVGATARQVRKMVHFEAFVLGLIGIPLGILSGILGIGVTIKVISPIIQSSIAGNGVSLRLVISPMVIIATVFFSALIILISAYLPARRAARVSPIEAIRLTGDISIKGRKLKTSRLTRWLFGFEGELALKNLKRNRKRYAATVMSLFISIVLYVSFSAFITYGFKSTEMYYDRLPYDLGVFKYHDSSEGAEKFYEEVSSLEGIEEYSIVRSFYASIVEKDLENSRFRAYIDKYSPGEGVEEYHVSFSINTMNKEAYDKYLKEIGVESENYGSTDRIEAVLINKDMVYTGRYVEYKPADVSEGDILHLAADQYDEAAAIEFDVEIAKAAEKLPFGISYNNTINLLVCEEDFEVVLSLIGEENANITGGMFISADNPDRLAETIFDLNDNHFNTSVDIYNVSSTRNELAKTKLVISIFLYGFISLITLIGVTNIFNTISTNVALRRREFAMLKSVGLTPKGFNKILRYESIFYGLKALLYGLPVSILISLLMYNSVLNSFRFELILPWKSIITCITGVFAITFATMIHAGRKMKNDNIADVLKQEYL